MFYNCEISDLRVPLVFYSGAPKRGNYDNYRKNIHFVIKLNFAPSKKGYDMTVIPNYTIHKTLEYI